MKICIIGIGGVATHLINELIKSYNIEFLSKNMIKYGYISANIEDIHQIQDYGLQIARLEESKKMIKKFLKTLTFNADLVITITAIGGGCGTNIIILESKNIVNSKSVYDDFKQMDKSMKNRVMEYLFRYKLK